MAPADSSGGNGGVRQERRRQAETEAAAGADNNQLKVATAAATETATMTAMTMTMETKATVATCGGKGDPAVTPIWRHYDANNALFGIFFQGLAKEVIDGRHLGLLADLSFHELPYRSLELLQPNSFISWLISRRDCFELPREGSWAYNSLREFQEVIFDLLPL